MDLSAVIFVVLALAWAVYLIPKALSHHDELASDRLVEGHSDKVRILSRTRTVTETVVEDVVPAPDAAPAAPAIPAPAAAPVTVPVGATEARPAPVAPGVPTRASARRAARNRRRVLGVLALVLAVTVGLAVGGLVPWLVVTVPAVLVVAFLVVARLSVRRMQQARVTAPRPAGAAERLRQAGVEATDPTGATGRRAEAPVTSDATEQALAQLGEDTDGAHREELEAALADDGSLWDPLPMTLPTYVNKARARRTVRTIELTGINSSGHDEADTAVAREAEQAASAGSEVEQDSESRRKVVGG